MAENKTKLNKNQARLLLWILGVLIALGPFSIDMYLPGFEDIALEFGVSVAEVGLSLTSYFIGLGIGQLAYGPLMDKFGRKKPLAIGLIIYIIAAISCLYSPSLEWLIVSRFIMALGASAGMVASKAILRDFFPAKEIARAMSFLMLIVGVAPIIAPTVGSFITAHYTWHYIFLVLAIFAALIFAGVFLFLPESIQPDKTVRLRFKKVMTKYRGIFMDKVFFTFAISNSLTVGALFAYISHAPVLFMNVYGFTHLQFGWIFSINAAGLILGSQINRWVLKRWSVFRISIFNSILLVVLSTLFLLSGYIYSNFYTTFVILFLILFLLGFQNPNTTALSLDPFEKKAARASALIGGLKMTFGAITSYIISEFSSASLIPLAIVLLVCFVISSALLFRFQKKEKRALISIGR
ncbi:MAG TPA: multidrug effflux MFS transporter [Flavobacteriaceae bacterium]|nr:multidrug effflux MFS transporter [Flavobacteriaceae bacterium]